MVREIIRIDREKCDGCGLCVLACHEGAICMADGKAVLTRDDYCDGLGDCLPICPTGAISFEEREAAAYDEAAVKKNLEQSDLPCGCPGTNAKVLHREENPRPVEARRVSSGLRQWPVQIKLVAVNAAYFDNAHLLVSADCAAYAYGNFHQDYMRNSITLIGCPKLDEGDYSEKLTAILKNNNIKSVTVVRMEVPCCGGIEKAVKTALMGCGKLVPWQVATISTDGRVLGE